MMKIAVFGASGLVGSYAARKFSKDGDEVVTVSHKPGGSDYHLDASNLQAVSKMLEKERPDVVFNAIKSGISTDTSEIQKAETWASNVTVPQNLASTQNRLGYLLFHMSSDWVFPGIEGETYHEDSQTYPLNFYAYTKAIAEERVRLLCEHSIIARSTGIFGVDPGGKDFFSRFYATTKAGREFMAADDQFSQPIYAGELCDIASNLINSKCTGIFNCVGPDYVSRFQLATMFADGFGFNPALVKKADSSKRAIRMPMHLRLDITKLRRISPVNPLKSQISTLKREMIEHEISKQ